MKLRTALVLAQQVLSTQATPTVHLQGYGSFSGTEVNQSLATYPLSRPVDAWLGIDFAVQERFHPLRTTPPPFNGTRSATNYGKVCIQDPESTPYEQSEDCLNFNVHRPAGIPFNRSLPTLVWIYGGAFVQGSARSFDGAAFVAASQEPLMVVTFNYRLNSLGFLPSPLFEEEGLLNLGLRDQQFFLEFIHKHLRSFGGDPDQITLGGRSAGAHSVGIHYFHNYGNSTNKPLFARAIAQSGARTARSFPPASYARNIRDFTRFTSYLNCSTNTTNALLLSCLRNAPISSIQTISTTLFNDSAPTITWPFQPALGGPLLELPAAQSNPYPLPLITTTTTDEGKYYLPGNISTNSQFLTYLSTSIPQLNATDLSLLETLYPDPSTQPASPYAGSTNSTQYDRLSAAWSDYAYICPSRYTAQRASRAGGRAVYKMRFDVVDAPTGWRGWRGVPHTSDTRYTWDDGRVPDGGVGRVLSGAFGEFVGRGRVEGWVEYGGSGGEEVVIEEGGRVVRERDGIRVRECEFWNDEVRAERLFK